MSLPGHPTAPAHHLHLDLLPYQVRQTKILERQKFQVPVQYSQQISNKGVDLGEAPILFL